MKNWILTILLLSSAYAFAQVPNSLRDKNYFKQIGILISDSDISHLEYYQLEKLAAYDFNAYRNYNIERTIQIVKGPAIYISSLLDMQASGHNVPPELIEKKKEVPPGTAAGLHTIVTEIDLGFQYKPIRHTEKDGNEK